jgi:hypothetical protein
MATSEATSPPKRQRRDDRRLDGWRRAKRMLCMTVTSLAESVDSMGTSAKYMSYIKNGRRREAAPVVAISS